MCTLPERLEPRWRPADPLWTTDPFHGFFVDPDRLPARCPGRLAAGPLPSMETLRLYYRRRLQQLALGLAALAVLYQTLRVNLAEAPDTPPFVNLALRSLESALLAAVFLGGEWLIRTRLWKIERPNLDFSGDWDAVTTYTHVEKPGPSVPEGPLTGQAARHDVTIEQDCLGISIAPTAGAYNNWYSLAMNILGDRQVGYAYEVNYKNNPAFPQKAIGYERMTVVRWEKKGLLKKGRPLEMTGEFAHCVQPNEPAYRGTVVFTRRVTATAEEAHTAGIAPPAEVPATAPATPAAVPADA